MQVMLGNIQFRTFCLIVCCLKRKIRIYKNIILPVVLFGCETWSLTLREEHKQRVFENRVLRRIYLLKKDEWYEDGEHCIMRSLMTCNLCEV
jgi:hypothetical protein